MRLFIALETLPIQDGLFEVENKIKKRVTGVKWVRKENLHLTLKFLGEVDTQTLQLTKESVEKVCSEEKKFDFSIAHISGFPTKKSSRVIFIGINKGADKIQEVMKKIDEEMNHIGFKREKSYIPHITIGRVKFGYMNLEKLSDDFCSIKAYALGIEIIKSELTKLGPIYKSIFKFDFK